MRQVQDTCNPGRRRRYPRPAALQTTALVLSESNNEESSDSNATWGWCSDSNDQGRAEQLVSDLEGDQRLLGDPQVQVSDLVRVDDERSSSKSEDSSD